MMRMNMLVAGALATAATFTDASAEPTGVQTSQKLEDARKEAAEAAVAAEKAAQRADAAAARLQALLGAQVAPVAPAPLQGKEPPALAANQRGPIPPRPYNESNAICGKATRDDIASLDYFRQAGACETALMNERPESDPPVSSSEGRVVTGFGTSFAVDTQSTTATLTVGRSWTTRRPRIGDFGRDHHYVEQQRVSRWSAEIGLRTNVDEGSKSQASIATFGALDRLTSGTAVTLQFGRTLSTSEPWRAMSWASSLSEEPAKNQ